MTSEQSAQCAVIESYVQSHLESWIGAEENRRQWDLIRLRFVNDPKVAAIIYRLPSGRHEIMIGRNFVCSLLELVEKCWGKFGDLSDDNQRWKVEAIAKYSVLLVYYHEFAHVIRGHHYELARKTKQTSSQFCFGETSGRPAKGCVYLTRWMERDADIVGADFFAMMTALPHWLDKPKRERKTLARLFLTAAAAVCVQIESWRRDLKCAYPIHDAPYLRWLTFIEALGASLVRELELDDEDLLEIIAAILTELQTLPEWTKLPPDLWALQDMQKFRNETRRHTRILDSYQRFQEKYLINRSSFLPDVGSEYASNTQEAIDRTVSNLRKTDGD